MLGFGLGLTRPLAAAGSPANLFRPADRGLLLDPATASSLFQDVAGTIPVTGAGQSVGLVHDLSNRGMDAVQATAASRPLLQIDGGGRRYLAFDGTDDGLATASIDFSASDKMTLIAGVRKISDAAGAGILAEISANVGTTNGACGLSAPLNSSGVATFGFLSRGTLFGTWSVSGAAYLAPVSAVVTGIGHIGGDVQTLRVNGVQVATAATDQGSGSFGNHPVFIGRRGGTSLPFNGWIYGLFLINRLLSASDTGMVERWMAARSGVVI